MKKALILTAGLLATSYFSAQAQTTKLGSAGNKANYGTGNQRPTIGSGSTGSTTVDGSNGSATNDGASGQSGSPSPLPSATANQKTANSNGLKVKSSNKTSRTSGVSSRTITQN